MTRDTLIDLLWQMLRQLHADSVTIRVPEGVAILQENGKHFLVSVSDSELVPV